MATSKKSLPLHDALVHTVVHQVCRGRRSATVQFRTLASVGSTLIAYAVEKFHRSPLWAARTFLRVFASGCDPKTARALRKLARSDVLA